VIESHWKRIAGMCVEPDGSIALVWMALDRDTDTVHLYDTAVFQREVLAVVAQGINARGRWIPVAWRDKDIADKLLNEHGVNIIPEGIKETKTSAEVSARDVWERMRTGRFKVDRRLGDWVQASKQFYRDDSQIPLVGHPLMSATRFAIERLDYARAQSVRRIQSMTYPKLAIV
jgi:hypothetical protein